jgi:holo-[acyl-carrier protein] synthase
MNVLGIGSDIVDIRRVEQVLSRHGWKFIKRLCHEHEWKFLSKDDYHIHTAWVAKRFSAKEAMLKALGSGVGSGISWHDVQVFSEKNGKPSGYLSVKACAFIYQHYPIYHHNTFQMMLSMSDEFPYALAVAVLKQHHSNNIKN